MAKDASWDSTLLSKNSKIVDAIKNLDSTGKKIVLVVDDYRKLIGIISDGDIRRGLLKGAQLSDEIDSVINHSPFIAEIGMTGESIRELMISKKVTQVPILSKERVVLGLFSIEGADQTPSFDNTVIIMAGGKGMRLRPYTEKCPKPMLNIAGKPLIEHIIEGAKEQGFKNFVISINYLGEIIENHFGSGKNLDVNIKYLREGVPLGTAGALFDYRKNVPTNETVIIINGDIRTKIRYDELLSYHNHHGAQATMAVRLHEIQNPFGVVTTSGIEITEISEKPINRSYVNAGIYAVETSALDILDGDYCDMPSLFTKIRESGELTIAFPVHESWVDIGSPEEYLKTNLENW